MDTVNFTEAAIKRMQPPAEGMIEYQDEKQRALTLRVRASGRMTWTVFAWIGRQRRKTLGTWPDIPVTTARELASETLQEWKAPASTKGRSSLRAAREDMLIARKYKPRTADDYRVITERHCPALLDKAVDKITRDDISQAFRRIDSPSQANHCFRVVRACINYWIAMHSLEMANPAQVLSDTRSWHKIRRKQTVIHAHQLANWWHTVEEQLLGRIAHPQAQMAGRYYQALLLTGLRSTELSSLGVTAKRLPGQVGTYDYRGRMLNLYDPKNNTDVIIPLSAAALPIFEAQRKSLSGGHWLWPSAQDSAKPTNDAGLKHWRKIVVQESGVSFTRHDLRRTFITIGEALDLSPYVVKRLAGHTVGDQNDVTSGYIVSALPRLRRATETISEYMMGIVAGRDPFE